MIQLRPYGADKGACACASTFENHAKLLFHAPPDLLRIDPDKIRNGIVTTRLQPMLSIRSPFLFYLIGGIVFTSDTFCLSELPLPFRVPTAKSS